MSSSLCLKSSFHCFQTEQHTYKDPVKTFPPFLQKVTRSQIKWGVFHCSTLQLRRKLNFTPTVLILNEDQTTELTSPFDSCCLFLLFIQKSTWVEACASFDVRRNIHQRVHVAFQCCVKTQIIEMLRDQIALLDTNWNNLLHGCEASCCFFFHKNFYTRFSYQLPLKQLIQFLNIHPVALLLFQLLYYVNRDFTKLTITI